MKKYKYVTRLYSGLSDQWTLLGTYSSISSPWTTQMTWNNFVSKVHEMVFIITTYDDTYSSTNPNYGSFTAYLCAPIISYIKDWGSTHPYWYTCSSSSSYFAVRMDNTYGGIMLWNVPEKLEHIKVYYR